MHVKHTTPQGLKGLKVLYHFSWEPGTRSLLFPSLCASASPPLHLSRGWGAVGYLFSVLA